VSSWGVLAILLWSTASRSLARHVANAILREDSRGARLSKETKDSPRRIDAALAMRRAAELAGDPGPTSI
jgi:hypothetical protein